MEFTATTQIATGSEKQIAWATDIRARVINEINAYIAESMAKHAAAFAALTDEQRAQIDADRARAQAAIDAKTDARWWINDARHMSGKSVMSSAANGTL